MPNVFFALDRMIVKCPEIEIELFRGFFRVSSYCREYAMCLRILEKNGSIKIGL